MIRILLTGLLLLNMGCSSTKSAQSQKNILPEHALNLNTSERSEEQIIFLTLQMTLIDSLTDEYQFSMIQTKYANGVLNRNAFNQDTRFEAFYLYCEIMDDNNQRLDFIKVQNPLQKVFEYSPDKISIEKRMFESKTGELFIRFQLTKQAKHLLIYKPQTDLKKLKKIYHAKI